MNNLEGTGDPDSRAGYVALVGKPNVGKSTLLNRILGQKLSIVTHKPQTTRHRVMGIWSEGNTQIVFLDTPGILEPSYRLQNAMLQAARRAITDADLILAIHDATEPVASFDEVLPELSIGKKTVVVALNKIDRVVRKEMLPVIQRLHEATNGAEVVPISAKNGDNVDRLLSVVVPSIPFGPPLYPADQLTEQPERFFVAEIVREQALLQFRDEVPYAVQVEIEQFLEGDGERRDEIHATICVERESQKRILVGSQGSAIRELGTKSRQAIEAFLERDVVLKLFVKVVPDWRQDPRRLRQMGYEG
jgi:GTP-binding protein Era